jgi:hypothetical protein
MILPCHLAQGHDETTIHNYMQFDPLPSPDNNGLLSSVILIISSYTQRSLPLQVLSDAGAGD